MTDIMASDSKILRVTLVQADLAWEDRDRNLDRFLEILSPLKGNTDLVILPEMFTTGFTMNSSVHAEEMDGAAVRWMKNRSEQLGAALAGSLIIRGDERICNRLVWVAPGEEPVYYDKRHLFRMGGETDHYDPGRERLIVNWKGWRIMPLVCYDLRFPVWSRNRQDYDLLFYVANWPAARREVWKTLLCARAIENQAFVAGVNRVGTDGREIRYSGDSLLSDPRGQSISHIKPYLEGTETLHISLKELESFREKFPVHFDADNFMILP